MESELSRRDFLKLIALLPFLKISWDALSNHAVNIQSTDSPNVLMIVFDALSATNVSLYGYQRLTTPNFARFAEKSTVFNRHYSSGNFTSPGTASLLTGTYPWTHRAFHLYGTIVRELTQNNLFSAFPGDQYTRISYSHNDLAASLLYQFRKDIDFLTKSKDLELFNESLLAEGVFSRDRNAAFLGERMLVRGERGADLQLPSSLFLSMLHQLWRTNEKTDLSRQYRKSFPLGLPSTNGTPFFFLLEDAIDWVMNQIGSSMRPYLGYFHFFPPHEPYNTRVEFIDRFKDGMVPLAKPAHFFTQGFTEKTIRKQRREYDEYIAYVDSEFGRLYDFLEQHDLMKNTCVVLTSDHGEMFERGIVEHNTPTLFEPVIHVPLVIHRPGQNERVDVNTTTNSVDILPTLTHMMGLPNPDWSEGVVLPGFSDVEIKADRSIYCVEAKTNPKNAPLKKVTVALIKDNYKLIFYSGYKGYTGVYEMYNLAEDPDEMNNIYSEDNSTAIDIKNELQVKLNQVNQPYLPK